jgi:mannan endo-1,4-beta-mannosidase
LPPGPSAAALRGNLLANLIAQMEQPSVMFGHQRYNITGVNSDGSQWLATEGDLDRSDAKGVTGQHPIVMGFDVFDLAVKPATWAPTPAVHAAAARHVFESGGIVTLDWHMRGCANTDSFNAAGNEACLCRLANDDAYLRTWLVDGNLAKLADALVATGLDRVPIVFRPLHELSGNWFWWGKPYWSCTGAVTGEAAFQKVYRTIVTYLRDERGLDNLLFAFAPDRFDDGHANDVTRYLAGYPGDAYVDVMGIDLYYRAQPSFAAETALFRTYLSTVASAAYAHGKAAALTEVGDTLLATDTSPWFTEQLLPLLANSHMAYALTWENRRDAAQEFWLPYPGHRADADFQRFEASDATLFLGDAPALDQPPAHGYPMCATCTSDGDGDGWGWEQSQSCRVGSWCL